MHSNPFELPAPAAVSHPSNQIAYAIVAALLLGALLAYGIDLLVTVLGAEPVAEDASDFHNVRHDTAFFLFTLRYRLFDLLVNGVWGLLIARYLLERTAISGYRRPQRLLATLLAVSLLASLLAGVIGQLVWSLGYPLLEQVTLYQELHQWLVELLSMLSGSLAWLIAVPLPLWLCLRLFRRDALSEPKPLPVSRLEAALLASLTLATLLLQLSEMGLRSFSYLSDLPLLSAYYGTGLALALVAFAGAWLVLPATLQRLRPLALIGACLVSLFCVVLIGLGGTLLLVLWLYSAGDQSAFLGAGLLGIGILALWGLMQAFALRVIYRPLAAQGATD